MPKRLLDGDGLWLSDKLSLLPEKFRPEYANIVPLALADGAFECSPGRVWRYVYAYNRKEVTLEFVKDMLDSMEKVGLISRIDHKGKCWGFFIGMDKDGRLPPHSQRNKHCCSGLPLDTIQRLSRGGPKPNPIETNGDAPLLTEESQKRIFEENSKKFGLRKKPTP